MGWSWAAACGVQGRGHIVAAARLQLVKDKNACHTRTIKLQCVKMCESLLRVSMQSMQSAIFFYRICPSVCLAVRPLPVLRLNEFKYYHTF